MSQETIEVTVGPDGNVEIHVRGVEGMACVRITEELSRLLGSEVISHELTPEAYIDTTNNRGTQQWH
jgi:hypothetical protein